MRGGEANLRRTKGLRMSATIHTLGGDVRYARRGRKLEVRRAVACLAGAFVGGGVAWNWASLLAGALHATWIGPVAGLCVGLWLTLLIATIDADEPA